MSEKAEKTREKILDTAIKHFLRDGFSGASLRSIVKDAGLTTGAFYKYYPTKEMLFDALIDPYIEHIYMKSMMEYWLNLKSFLLMIRQTICQMQLLMEQIR